MEEIISFAFDAEAIIVIILSIFISSFVHSAVGIGYGVLFLLLLPKYIDYTGALSIMYILYVFIISYTLIKAGRRDLIGFSDKCLIQPDSRSFVTAENRKKGKPNGKNKK